MKESGAATREDAFEAILGCDDHSVHRQNTVKPRRAGLSARARHDHRVVVGVRHVQIEGPRLARGEIDIDVRCERVRVVAVIGEFCRLVVQVIDVGVDRILRRDRILDVMHDRVGMGA